jgi:hypothetical protein
VRVHVYLAALLLSGVCAAKSRSATDVATAHLSFKVVVPPVFRVISMTPKERGHEYKVWTNLRFATIGSRLHRFAKVGEATVFVPASNERHLVYSP